jgi:hypothetical protein
VVYREMAQRCEEFDCDYRGVPNSSAQRLMQMDLDRWQPNWLALELLAFHEMR